LSIVVLRSTTHLSQSGGIDGDGDVDLSDYGGSLNCYNGPANPPACA
jgi:hypothetical protein